MGGHDDVTLTARERRTLSEIESVTHQLDPGLARRLTGKASGRSLPSRRARLVGAAVAAVVGAVVVVATFAWSTGVAFAGVLLMAAAMFVAASAAQELVTERPVTPVQVRRGGTARRPFSA